MSKSRIMGAGSSGYNYGANKNKPGGGGGKKQGLPPRVGHARNARLINTHAGGDKRNVVFCINQLGGVGGKSHHFATTADSIKECKNGDIAATPLYVVKTNGELGYNDTKPGMLSKFINENRSLLAYPDFLDPQELEAKNNAGELESFVQSVPNFFDKFSSDITAAVVLSRWGDLFYVPVWNNHGTTNYDADSSLAAPGSSVVVDPKLPLKNNFYIGLLKWQNGAWYKENGKLVVQNFNFASSIPLLMRREAVDRFEDLNF